MTKIEIVETEDGRVGFQSTSGDKIRLLGLLDVTRNLILNPPEAPLVQPVPADAVNRINGAP